MDTYPDCLEGDLLASGDPLVSDSDIYLPLPHFMDSVNREASQRLAEQED